MRQKVEALKYIGGSHWWLMVESCFLCKGSTTRCLISLRYRIHCFCSVVSDSPMCIYKNVYDTHQKQQVSTHFADHLIVHYNFLQNIVHSSSINLMAWGLWRPFLQLRTQGWWLMTGAYKMVLPNPSHSCEKFNRTTSNYFHCSRLTSHQSPSFNSMKRVSCCIVKQGAPRPSRPPGINAACCSWWTCGSVWFQFQVENGQLENWERHYKQQAQLSSPAFIVDSNIAMPRSKHCICTVGC